MSVRRFANGSGKQLLLPILAQPLQPVHIPEGAIARLGVDRGHLHDPDDADAKIDREPGMSDT